MRVGHQVHSLFVFVLFFPAALGQVEYSGNDCDCTVHANFTSCALALL